MTNPSVESLPIIADAFARAVDPILNMLSDEMAQRVAGFHCDEELQRRIEELANKANEGDLTDDERAEYEGYIRANRFIAILQAQARRRQAMAS